MSIRAFLLAWLLWPPAALVRAEPLPFDYRCGPALATGSAVPTDGWRHAANGVLPRGYNIGPA